jgi:uncharacterized protein YjbJ (UPF0337 family)
MKATWADLTDDEIAQTEWKAEAIAGMLQAKYGMTKQDAENALDDLVESL